MAENIAGAEGAQEGPAPMQVLVRGLRILTQFTSDEPALSLAELGRRTGLHRATVYRFVKTLESEGFLALDPVTGLYRVGPTWATSLYLLGGNNILSEILDRELWALANATGESASISVRKGDQIRMIDVTPASSGFAPIPPKSPLVPLSEHSMVHARVHLAYAGEDTRQRMLDVPAVRHTEYSVTDRAKIEARLAKVVKEGIAYSRGEYRIGSAALAVPVFSRGSVIAAAGLVMPVERYDANLERYEQALRATATAMGKGLD